MDFRPDGAWRARTNQIRAFRRELFRSGDLASLNRNAGAAPAPSLLRVATTAAPNVLSGTVHVPVVLIAYSNVPVPYPTSQFQDVLFTPTPATLNRAYSLKTYYEELSNGLITLEGEVFESVRMDTTNTYYEDGCNGIGVVNTCPNPQRFGQMLIRALDSVSNRPGGDTVWEQFDNDGADGLPNSGDDDGVVDFVTFLHPTVDGACTQPGIWSHRYQVRYWNAGSPYVTKTPRKDASGTPIPGQFIRVDDYTIQSALGGNTGCLGSEIMPIGTIAHETGHAFGLPDLYDTDGTSLRTEGIGEWGIMGSGNFTRSYSPASYEAWSLVELGWVTLKELVANGVIETRARQVSDTVFLARTPFSDQYFLLENRQAVHSDTAQMNPAYSKRKAPGLLIWFIDDTRIASGRPSNRVNTGLSQGVSLMQADGLNQLRTAGSGRNRGDPGDPFPGATANTKFGYSTNPASRTLFGEFAGFMVDHIEQLPSQVMRFRFTRRGLSVFRPANFAAAITVNGARLPWFEEVIPEGEQVTLSTDATQLSNGDRTQLTFLSWSNGGPREQVLVSGAKPDTVAASYSAAHRLKVTGAPVGGVTASVAGDLTAGFFLPNATPVTLTAAPLAGMTFVGWQSDTVATGNTLTLPMRRPYDVTAVYLPNQVIAVQDATDDLLGTPRLSLAQRDYLDQLGNRNGGYDVGDYLALLDRSGVAPSAELLRRLNPARTVEGGRVP